MSKLSEQTSDPHLRKRALDTDVDDAQLDDLPRKKARSSSSEAPTVTQPTEYEEIEEDSSSVLSESSEVSSSGSGSEEDSLSDSDDPEDFSAFGPSKYGPSKYDHRASDGEEEDSSEDENSSEDEENENVDEKNKVSAPSSLRTRLRNFLSWMKGANENLDPNAESGVEIIPQHDVEEPQEEIRIRKDDDEEDEEEGDGKPYVEMNVGLGVLEERSDNDTDSDEEGSSSEEEDAMNALLGRTSQKGVVQEVDTD